MGKEDLSSQDTLFTDIPVSTSHSRLQQTYHQSAIKFKAVCIALAVSLAAESAVMIAICRRQVVQIPYVIEINRDGDVRYVKDAVSQLSGWKPSTATVIKVLHDYITALRSVSVDRKIQEDRIKKIYSFTTGSALRTAEQYLLDTKPLDRSENERCEVSVYAATPLINGQEDLFQLDWNERVYALNGTLKKEQNYRAVMRIKHYVPRTESVQEINPLGIYITEIKISEIKDGYVIYEKS